MQCRQRHGPKRHFILVLTMCLLVGNSIVNSFELKSTHATEIAIDDDIYVEPTSMFSSPWISSVSPVLYTTPINVTTARTKIETLSKVFKKSVQKIKQKQKRMDIVFLIDSSSSVGKTNFHSELKFVKKFLSDFNVSFNHTRVAIVTFSSQGKIVSVFIVNKGFCYFGNDE